MRLILVFFISLTPCLKKAEARTWQLSQGSYLEPDVLKDLQQKFPSIPDSQALSELLRAIGGLTASSSIEATEDADGSLRIHIKKNLLVVGIEVETLTRRLRFEVEAKLSRFIGQVSTPELQNMILSETRQILQRQGYYLAKVELELIGDGNNLLYKLSLEEEFPCTVEKFELNFRLPLSIQSPFERGMYCDIDEIKVHLNDLEAKLIDAGYNQQRILPPEIEFNEKTNTAIVKISGTLGKKVRARVESPIKPPPFISLIFGDELNSIDQSLTDPDAMAAELTRQYKSRGYDDVQVSSGTLTKTDDETIEYLFEVKPGPEYLVTEVQFEGLMAISSDEALDSMQLYQTIGNSPRYSLELSRQARDFLVAYYKQVGFWDAQVFEPRVIKNPGNGQVRLVYVVKEGKRRIFDSLSILGNKDISANELETFFPVDRGESLSWQQIIDFEKSIRRVYRKKGYLNVQIELELVQNRQFRDIQTKVIIRIKEGIRSKFGRTFVKGLVKTQMEVVTREMRFTEGDWYDPDLIEESRQALIDLGLFSSVSVSPTEERDENKAIISYTVLLREARAGAIGFGPGWTNEGLRFSVESSYNNIGGTGRKIFSKGIINQEKDQTPLGYKTLLGRYAGVGYVEPYLLDYPVDGTISFNHKAQAQEKSWEISRSAEATATHKIRRFSPKTQIEMFTLYKESREEAEGNVKKATLTESGNLQIRELGFRQVSDGRDNLAWPTRGYRLNTELSFADFIFGGGLKYTRWSLGFSTYKELLTNFVFAAGFQVTSYNNIRRIEGPNVLPSTERLSTGGSESNRGFRENTLGPVFITEEGTEIFDGGSRRGQYKAELRYQLIQDTLALTLFADSSNSSFSGSEEKEIQKEYAKLETSTGTKPQLEDNEYYPFETVVSHPQYLWTKNYVSYGTSLNLLTPLGSVNISVGWPWRRCLNNQDSCAHPRGNSAYRQLKGGTIALNIGANF